MLIPNTERSLSHSFSPSNSVCLFSPSVSPLTPSLPLSVSPAPPQPINLCSPLLPHSFLPPFSEANMGGLTSSPCTGKAVLLAHCDNSV